MSIFVLSSCTRSGEVGVNPGDMAPDFRVQNLEGKEVALSSFRGKVVLLNFWATWCAPCIAEMPALERLYSKYKSKGFEVVAVAGDDTVESVREFQRKYGLSFTILLDSRDVTAKPYRIIGFPESFVIGRDGKLIMFTDPDDGNPTVRMTGPRDWDSEEVTAQIEKLTTTSSSQSPRE